MTSQLSNMNKLAESILITGANRGIGLELIRQIAASHNPKNLFAVCRNPNDASELKQLADIHSSITILQLSDVRDYASYDSLSDEVEKRVGDNGLNVLINNAGVSPKGQSLNDVTPQQMAETFEINAISPLMLVKKFRPLLEKAASASPSSPLSCSRSAIINISTQMGSISDNGIGSFYSYRSSKAALNMITKSLSIDLQPAGVLVACIHPGWVQTDMGSSRAPMSVQDSARQILDVLMAMGPDKNGAFVNYANKIIPW
uniref:Short-chain dehydrogenase n=1 Tax=Strigamia maritima TaxID=126957 RepID=T1JIA7_STRMM